MIRFGRRFFFAAVLWAGAALLSVGCLRKKTLQGAESAIAPAFTAANNSDAQKVKIPKTPSSTDTQKNTVVTQQWFSQHPMVLEIEKELGLRVTFEFGGKERLYQDQAEKAFAEILALKDLFNRHSQLGSSEQQLESLVLLKENRLLGVNGLLLNPTAEPAAVRTAIETMLSLREGLLHVLSTTSIQFLSGMDLPSQPEFAIRNEGQKILQTFAEIEKMAANATCLKTLQIRKFLNNMVVSKDGKLIMSLKTDFVLHPQSTLPERMKKTCELWQSMQAFPTLRHRLGSFSLGIDFNELRSDANQVFPALVDFLPTLDRVLKDTNQSLSLFFQIKSAEADIGWGIRAENITLHLIPETSPEVLNEFAVVAEKIEKLQNEVPGIEIRKYDYDLFSIWSARSFLAILEQHKDDLIRHQINFIDFVGPREYLHKECEEGHREVLIPNGIPEKKEFKHERICRILIPEATRADELKDLLRSP